MGYILDGYAFDSSLIHPHVQRMDEGSRRICAFCRSLGYS